ncbi:MAG: hypothetical protein CBB68_10035 [Rhodospirillaceae bacterium TMED8]|nr:DUF1192 domain-containing protein [Magnetovibrio sp.]OUT50192.1 MAG: hypothetical protein CBB68_10035 [Rhodospirillaceae bacterium TMED8]|tara:strand:- start:842 stop:1024 length:183 start_codon:yes stop_codon:yes gene_type:complete
MDLGDLQSSQKKSKLKNLEEMSIEALDEYIIQLELEIRRVREAIVSKDMARSGAESFFKN